MQKCLSIIVNLSVSLVFFLGFIICFLKFKVITLHKHLKLLFNLQMYAFNIIKCPLWLLVFFTEYIPLKYIDDNNVNILMF